MLQIAERFAASGIDGQTSDIYEVAARFLAPPHEYSDKTAKNDLRLGPQFGLHSPRSLLWLWRYASKLPKKPSTINHDDFFLPDDFVIEWSRHFHNTSKPLVLDVGCGLGLSLLGLASLRSDGKGSGQHPFEISLDWPNCNYVGADINGLFINYARAIIHRKQHQNNDPWQRGRIQFFQCTAEVLLRNVLESYPGPVRLILIQFPTPFSVVPTNNESYDSKKGDQKNSQLPTNVHSGFMVSPKLLSLARECCMKMEKGSDPGHRTPESRYGMILFQSNCEDVAVKVRFAATMGKNEQLFVCRNVTNYVRDEAELDNVSDMTMEGEEDRWKGGKQRQPRRIPRRTTEWINRQSLDNNGKDCVERAVGPGWSRDPLLPLLGATETEISCMLEGRPIHRFLLMPAS